jgi:hypothetical protein
MENSMRHLAFVIAIVSAAGCGPASNPGNSDVLDPPGVDGGAQPDAYEGEYAAIMGTVWAPGQAPGQVPAGHEIPIYSALISLSPTRPAPIPQQTYCEKCVDPVGVHVFTAHDGTFALQNVVPGTYWLAIQKGQFRLEYEVTLDENDTLELGHEQTTLPSAHDPQNGMWIPRIAMAVGSYDHLEDILGKMGMGRVDTTGRFVPGSAAGVMDIYTNGASFNGITAGTLSNLVSDLDKMLQYHILFIPCANDTNVSALYNQANLRNIRDFVDAGGKLYVTDWSGEWADNVFPTQITLGGAGKDTPPEAYNPANDSWNTSLFGNADGAFYDSNNAEATDGDLYEWLSGQMGPIVDGYSSTLPYDPGNFTVEGNWNYIQATDMVQVGTDSAGMPIYDVPRVYIIGGQGTSTPKRPLTVTYEPAGCGRVLYSTYHTTDKTHNGLVPQERVLLYLIMEIGVCQSGPIIK